MAGGMRKLAKGKLINNPGYKPNGFKAYTRAAIRYNISPTIDGPLCAVKKVEHQGKFGANKTIGGRTHIGGHFLAKKLASGQTGDVPAQDAENNSLYLCPVTIGTQGQTLNLDFDTGSADLWVWSTELPAATQNATPKHTIFDPSKSSTWKKTTSTWDISYGDGSSASGDVGTDNVSIGGLVIEQQAVELAKQLSTSFSSGVGDGLLGLAFGTINTVKPKPVNTPVENMIAQGDISKDEELFTCWLSQPNADSFYTFGFIDTTSLNGATPAYAPVDNSQGFWMFDSASATLNGNTIARSGNRAIADTGTTLCLIDDTTLASIYGAIPGAKLDSQQQGWVFPTSTATDSLPSVGFAVGDTIFYVQKEDIAFQDLGNGFIYGGIQSRGSGQDFDILGDVFLRGVYAIFDVGNTQFGAVQRGTGADASAGSGAAGSGSGTTGSGSGSGSGSGTTGSGSGSGTTGSGSGSGTAGSGSGSTDSGHKHHHHHHHHQKEEL